MTLTFRRWAWNNPHITKKIAKEQRLTTPVEKEKKSSKTGRTRKRVMKPRLSLVDNLKNLHLLLQVPSFSRWPLQVRFFCEDVYQVWQGWNERVNSSIRDGIQVLLDLRQPQKIIDQAGIFKGTQVRGKRNRGAFGQGGIEGIDVGYSELKKHLEKSILSLAEGDLKCAICTINMAPRTAMALVCPQEQCRTVSHMACLATKFNEDGGVDDTITPTSGRCPGCRTELQWIDLVKELSLRVRGEKQIAEITKKPRERKTGEPKTNIKEVPQPIAHSFEVENTVNAIEDSVGGNIFSLNASDESLPDDWEYQGEEDDRISVMSGHSALSDGIEAATHTKCSSTAPKLPAMIEDSEVDDIEYPF